VIEIAHTVENYTSKCHNVRNTRSPRALTRSWQTAVCLYDTLPYRRVPWLYYTNTDYTITSAN